MKSTLICKGNPGISKEKTKVKGDENMTTTEIITLTVVAVIGAVCLLIAILSFCEKGYLFNNAYIHASEKERESMDKKPYYRQTGIIFALLSLVFFFNCLQIAFKDIPFVIGGHITVIAAIVYAAVSTALLQRKSGNGKS